jgi:hypothetical protein
MTGAVEPPIPSAFTTIEYQLPYRSLETYADGGKRFAEEVKEIAARTRSEKSRPLAYVELGKTFERYLGYHYLAFRFYYKALSLASHIPPDKRSAFIEDVNGRMHRLAMRRFEALSNLIYHDARVAHPELIVIKKVVNLLGDASRGRKDGDMFDEL